MELFLTAVLFFGMGFLFGKEKTEKNSFGKDKEQEVSVLRNGFGVTKDNDPTFAEQWMNILNYNGESQREVGYEETERTQSEEYLE